MTAPRIGVTSSLAIVGGERKHEPVAYLAAVARAGGDPHALFNEPGAVEAVLARVDALLLSGGPDVDPACYGGRRDAPNVEPSNRARDEFEIELARAARERGIPLLGICRGLQVVNVALGGTLIEDLPSEPNGAALLQHRQTKPPLGLAREAYAPGHDVVVEPDSLLAELTRATRFPTNTLHHQAVRAVAPELRAVAHTCDGVVEALEARFAHPFFLSVQWHPEILPLQDEPSARTFAALVAAARLVAQR